MMQLPSRDRAPGPTPPSFPPPQGEGGASSAAPVPSSPSPLWGGDRGGGIGARWLCSMLLLLTLTAPVLAIDPPYQRQMERLAEIMGSLYFLQPLCASGNEDWRAEMAELIALDEPDEDRRQRLAGAFNG